MLIKFFIYHPVKTMHSLWLLQFKKNTLCSNKQRPCTLCLCENIIIFANNPYSWKLKNTHQNTFNTDNYSTFCIILNCKHVAVVIKPLNHYYQFSVSPWWLKLRYEQRTSAGQTQMKNLTKFHKKYITVGSIINNARSFARPSQDRYCYYICSTRPLSLGHKIALFRWLFTIFITR